MSQALMKAIRRSEMVAREAFESAVRRKAVGGLDFISTGSIGGFSDWRKQQVYSERYNLMRGWVYAAINILASEAAGQSPMVAKLKGVSTNKPQGKKAYFHRRMTKTARAKTASVEYEVLEDHWIKDLLDQPNPVQNKWQFVYSFVANLCLTGWSYVVIGKHKKKLEMYCLPTTWCKPIHDPVPFAMLKVKNPRKVGTEPAILKREQFGFAHLPNPSDPLSALAPAAAQIMAIRIDDHIQTSQEAFFRNGIFPSVIITVGKSPYVDSEGRPVLTGSQRRQIFSAVKKVWGGVANYGNPAIVDGLIEKIDRLSATQNEMGWQRSEDKVRTRILSAFGIHPYILGESVSVGGYAQVANIEKRFYKRVNTLLDMLSVLLTNLLGGLDKKERLLIWYEECEVSDPQLRQQLLITMRKNNDITQNEMRAEVGFPPDEDDNEAEIPPVMLQGISTILGLLGSGRVQKEQAVALLEGLGLSKDRAEGIAGVGLAEPKPSAPPKPPLKPPQGSEEGESSEEGGEGEEGKIEEAMEELKRANGLLEKVMSPDLIAEEILESIGHECLEE